MARVRLRTRSRRPAGTDPVATEPFPSWTTVGNLDSSARGLVDPAGRVAVAGAPWVLDWWIGAEDRWHVPAEEAAVRQQLVGCSPVVETRVRVPSGDAVSRAYGARGPRGEDLLVVEVHNDSKVPVALALALSSATVGGIGSLGLHGTTVEIDGRATLHLARSPGRIAFSTDDDDRDARAVTLAGDAEPVRAVDITAAGGGAGATGVLLFPLAHTATLRVVIALDESDRAVEPAELPSPQQVASGWATQSRGGARIEVPDRRLREAITTATRALLLDGRGPEAARALDQMGFPAEAGRALARGGDRTELGAALAERADRWRLHRSGLEAGEAERLAVAIERWAADAEGDEIGRGSLPGLADLLAGAGEGRAADDVHRLAATIPPPPKPDPPALADLLDPSADARLLLAARAHLVAELHEGLAISPVVPDAWLGQGWEVHDLPTAFGRLSYAIRWHGERPALLWELDPHPGGSPARLSTPALDPAWSSTAPTGEALLAPVPVPVRPPQRRGLTIPVTIEPMRRPPS